MTTKADYLDVVRSCIVYEPIESHSGLQLDWWCDFRRAWDSFPMFMYHIGPLKAEPAGIETCGWELAERVPSLVRVRVTKSGEVYAYWRKPSRVTLIDDVCTTGVSFYDAEVALSKRGIAVVERVCILDRREEFGSSDLSLEVRSLFTTKDVM